MHAFVKVMHMAEHVWTFIAVGDDLAYHISNVSLPACECGTKTGATVMQRPTHKIGRWFGTQAVVSISCFGVQVQCGDAITTPLIRIQLRVRQYRCRNVQNPCLSNQLIAGMRTIPLATLIQSMQPGTNLMGVCFTAQRLDVAVTTSKLLQPKQLPDAAKLTAEDLLRLVRKHEVKANKRQALIIQTALKATLYKADNVQAGGILLGGSALFRTNGLTQFGARHLVSRVGGDAFGNAGEAADAVQLPISLW